MKTHRLSLALAAALGLSLSACSKTEATEAPVAQQPDAPAEATANPFFAVSTLP